MMSETQQFQKADTYFAKAIEKDPENATVYVHRGLLQLQWNGNVDKTVEYINKALELDEKCELAYESLGSIEVQRYVFNVIVFNNYCPLKFENERAAITYVLHKESEDSLF